MKGPNFFIVGAPRCGTTALYTYLNQHPDIFLPELKEPQYFSTDLVAVEPFSLPKSEAEYLSHFSKRREEKLAGEATAFYLYSKVAPRKIRDFCPAARIIIMLRNPVDMIHSYHSMNHYWGHEDIADFSEALNAEADRKLGKRLPKNCPYPYPRELVCYKEWGRYKSFVERYLNVFQPENVHVIDFDSFTRETSRVVQETYRFLDVDPNVLPTKFPVINADKKTKGHRSKRLAEFIRNPSWIVRTIARTVTPSRVRRMARDKIASWNAVIETRPPLDIELRKKLTAEFSQDVEELGRILGRDFRHWNK